MSFNHKNLKLQCNNSKRFALIFEDMKCVPACVSFFSLSLNHVETCPIMDDEKQKLKQYLKVLNNVKVVKDIIKTSTSGEKMTTKLKSDDEVEVWRLDEDRNIKCKLESMHLYV